MERKPVQLKTTTRLQTRYKSAQSNRVSSAPSTRASSRASGVTEALSKTPESDVSKSPPASAASTVKTLDGSSVREQVSPSPSSIASGSRPASGSNGSQQEARGSVRSKTASSVPSVASQVSSEQTVRSRGGSVTDGSSRTVTPFQVLSLPQSAASVRSASVASSLPEEDLTIASRSITPSQVHVTTVTYMYSHVVGCVRVRFITNTCVHVGATRKLEFVPFCSSWWLHSLGISCDSAARLWRFHLFQITSSIPSKGVLRQK